jgi:pilus assembly protein TadC
LDLYRSSSQSAGSSQMLVDALYEGVSFLISEIDESTGSWRNSIVATAKSARALSSFERLLRASLSDLPFRLSWAAEQNHESSALRRLIDQNSAVASLLFSTREQLDLETRKAPDAKASRRPLENYVITSIAIFYLFMLLGVIEFIWLSRVARQVEHWAYSWQQLSIPLILAVIALPFIVTTVVLREFDRTPRWYSYVLRVLPILAGDQK